MVTRVERGETVQLEGDSEYLKGTGNVLVVFFPLTPTFTGDKMEIMVSILWENTMVRSKC